MVGLAVTVQGQRNAAGFRCLRHYSERIRVLLRLSVKVARMGLMGTFGSVVAAREGQKQTGTLDQLLEEQRTTNRLLWALMSEEQRERYRRGE